MRKLLASTAVVTAMAIPVAAQDGEISYEEQSQQMDTMGIQASNLIDQRVYMAETDDSSSDSQSMADTTEGISEVPENWEMVGEVDDLLMTQEGDVRSLIVDAGGFLGMNETSKQIDLSNVRFIKDSDNEGEFFVVYSGDRSTFESQQEYDQAAAESEGMQRATARDDWQQSEQQVEEVDLANLTTEELLGAR